MLHTRSKANLLALVSAGLFAATATADSWFPGPHLNNSRGFSASTVDECGNIWVFGGMRRFSSSAPYFCLDDVENLVWGGTGYAASWTSANFSMPNSRMGHQAVCTGGFIYVIGGYTFTDHSIPIPIQRVDRFDWRSGNWDLSVPDLPMSVSGHASVVDKFGRIWVIGGGIPGTHNTRNTALAFDPIRPQLGWHEMPALNTARAFSGAVVDQVGRIWVIGGLDDGYQHHLDSSETIDPCSGGGWAVESPRLPSPVSNSVEAALGADGLIYITGGWDGWYSGRVARIDPRDSSSTWESRPPMVLPRNEHNLVLGRDGVLYALAGEAVNVVSQTSVETLYTGPCTGDLNFDRAVNLTDLSILIATFGSACP